MMRKNEKSSFYFLDDDNIFILCDEIFVKHRHNKTLDLILLLILKHLIQKIQNQHQTGLDTDKTIATKSKINK